MSLLPITLIGDKILRKKTSPVEDVDFKIVQLITNMFDTMRNAYGIGLAANQVGADKSIFIVDLSSIEEYKEEKPLVVINPKITFRSEEVVTMEEGCLSIPDIRGDVTRPESITLSYQNTDLEPQTLNADGLLARVIQHEYDHLQGILFTDLIDESLKKKLKKDIYAIKNRKVKFEYPVSENSGYVLA